MINWNDYDADISSNGLSQNQLCIFLTISRLYERVRKTEGADRLLEVWGIPWIEARKVICHQKLAASHRAAISRSIKRLEQRGLIIRKKGISESGYMTHVWLTYKGEKLAGAILKTNEKFGQRVENPFYKNITNNTNNVNRITAHSQYFTHNSVNKLRY